MCSKYFRFEMEIHAEEFKPNFRLTVVFSRLEAGVVTAVDALVHRQDGECGEWVNREGRQRASGLGALLNHS